MILASCDIGKINTMVVVCEQSAKFIIKDVYQFCFPSSSSQICRKNIEELTAIFRKVDVVLIEEQLGGFTGSGGRKAGNYNILMNKYISGILLGLAMGLNKYTVTVQPTLRIKYCKLVLSSTPMHTENLNGQYSHGQSKQWSRQLYIWDEINGKLDISPQVIAFVDTLKKYDDYWDAYAQARWFVNNNQQFYVLK